MDTAVFPGDDEARETILAVGRRMYEKNFVAANDGNISCKVAPDIIWATPTGVSKGFMKADQLVKLKLNGEIVKAGNLKVSSEIKMHLRLYNENPAINGVTHAHPVVSTSFAIAGMALDRAVYPEALVTLGVIPCVHYALPGTEEVPDSIAPYSRDYNGVLLANHGALTWGTSLMEAFFRLEAMEHYAQVILYTDFIMGKANILSRSQVDDIIKIRDNIGVSSGGVPSRLAARPGNLRDVINNPARRL
ncbi:MAG: class II aldolase/adducin family protein [Treponema sp.]|jgi:L-fuculose-phosphate aldolase|nr:class II aldolase/adducin family protein [Treponema sp.]